MNRPSREHVNMQIAQIISTRGTCARLQVGAVITLNNKIISTGYNGPGRDQEHCVDSLCNKDKPCQRSVHAEINALQSAFKVLWDVAISPDRKDQELVIYVTHQPCKNCSMKISAAGIKVVYFKEPYRLSDGIIYLQDSGIAVYKIDEHGNTQQV